MKLNAKIQTNLKYARNLWPALSPLQATLLRSLIIDLRFSPMDLQLLDGRLYVTHSGLLRLANREHCSGIHTQTVKELCDPRCHRWVVKSTVYKSPRSRGFVGYGDADPSNVSALVHGAELRVAETRAVNRALRKAYGIGTCSVEELGSFSSAILPAVQMKKVPGKPEVVSRDGRRPLRDRLCLLIRQHQLDPALVKSYAADYCDVAELRQAGREQIADFIKHLAEYAQNDRDGLLCQLASYARKPVCPAPATRAGETLGPEQEKAEGAA